MKLAAIRQWVTRNRELLALVPVIYVHSIWIDSKRLAEAARRQPAYDGRAPDIWPEKVGTD